jgi:hypothetical protein
MWFGLLARTREQQESPRQSLLAGIEKLVEEGFFNSDNP